MCGIFLEGAFSFFLSFFLIDNFWLRQRGQGSLLKKSEHLMWLFQWKVKKKNKEIQIMYNTSVPMRKPWTDGVRGGNIPHWGSKAIKQCCKPKLGVDLSPHREVQSLLREESETRHSDGKQESFPFDSLLLYSVCFIASSCCLSHLSLSSLFRQ